MSPLGTILIASFAGEDWSSVTSLLAQDEDYRVFVARSNATARTALAQANVDLIIAEDAAGEGLGLLAELRISHPDIVRVLALETGATLSAEAMLPSAIYQLIRKPLDPEQVGLVVKRGLEARELSRRHRLLSREFKLPADFPIYRDHQDPNRKIGNYIHCKHGQPEVG